MDDIGTSAYDTPFTAAIDKRATVTAPMLQLIEEKPVSSGLAVGLLAGAPHLLLSPSASLSLAAVTLALIGGAYIGFGVADGRQTPFATEFVVAIAFALAALAGLMGSPVVIPIALVAHGVWDLIHHRPSSLLAKVPGWYPPFCAVVDVVIAAMLFAAWL